MALTQVQSGILADSTQTYGMKNRIINGDMRIDQRNAGASVTAGSAYTLDRWNVDRVWSGSTVTIQQSSTAPAGFTNSMIATVSTGAAVASASYFSIQQFIEGYNVADLDFGKATAQSFTVSFWVRSSVTGTYGVGFRNSAFDLSYWTTYTINSANTWEQKFVTITAPTSGTWYTNNSYGLNVIFSLGCGSTNKAASNNAWNAGGKLGAIGETDLIATTGATFYVTGVQLEKGATATSFDYRPYGTELALCQRYYQLASRYEEWVAANVNTANTANASVMFIQPMRTSPTITLAPVGSSTGNISFLTYSGSTPSGLGTHGAISITSNGFRITAGGYTANGWAAGVSTAIYAYSNPTTVYTASAEL
jgi:hypothetical protein